MANSGETSSPDIHCVFVETSLDTRLAVLVNNHETVSDFKEKLSKEHKQCFPEVGEINISALKVKRRGYLYHIPDSMNLIKAFDSISRNWYMYVDVVRVETGELLTIIEKDNERGEGIRLAPRTADNLQTSELVTYPETKLETSSEPATEKKRKRTKSSKAAATTTSIEIVNQISGVPGFVDCVDAITEKKRKRMKRLKDHINQSIAAATTTSREIVNQINGVPGNVDCVDAISISRPISRRRILGNPLVEEIQKEHEMCEKIDGDVGSRKAIPRAEDNIQSDNFTSYPENQLETNSSLTTGPATEKKKKRKESSKDHINHSTAATTISRELVNEGEKVIESIDRVDAISESFPVSGGEKLVDTLVDAVQNENEMCEKIDDNVGSGKAIPMAKDNVHSDNFMSYPKNQLEANSGLTTGPSTEKKKKRKKSLKDHINQSTAATTISSEIVNGREKVIESIDRVDATPESFPNSRGEKLVDNLVDVDQNENEMGEKIDRDVGSRKTIPITADNIQSDNFVSYLENQLEASSGLTTGPATEKKKKQKKSSKDRINQSTAATTISMEIVNGREKVIGSIDRVDATSEPFPNSRGEKLVGMLDAIKNENEMGDKFVNTMGSREATLTSADKIQTVNSLQLADLTCTLHALAQESKTLGHIGKFTDGNRTPEHEVAKDNVVIDAVEAKSGKSAKKKKSKKAKTAAKEDTLVASGAQNAEHIKVVDGEGLDNVIRNVLDSLQEKKETQENSDKIGENSSKKPKKKSLDLHPSSYIDGSLDTSSDDDSNVTSMSWKQGNILAGEIKRFSGSLQDILRSSRSYKMAILRASQSQSRIYEDESPGLDFVPDSQVN